MGREFAKVSRKPVAQGRGCQHNRPMTTLPMLNPTLQTVLLLTANRIGYQQAGLSVAQLKIIQEVLMLSVFVPFAVFTCASRSSLTTCGPPCAWWVRCTSSSAALENGCL